jgi:hypothetical protein
MEAQEVINVNHRLSTVEEICNKMEKQLTKIFEVVVGDESFGQVGLIQRLVTLEKETERLKTFKNKLIGAALFGGAFTTVIIEVVKMFMRK